MDPSYLATLVFVGSNEKVYMPPKSVVYQRYLRKFSKQGKKLETDLGLEEVDVSASDQEVRCLSSQGVRRVRT